MDFWDSYDKPQAHKKTKLAAKRVEQPINSGKKSPETANISINISLPKLKIGQKLKDITTFFIKKFSRLFNFIKSVLTKKVVNVTLVAVIIFSLSMIGLQLITNDQSKEAVAVEAKDSQEQPSFQLIYPNGSKKDTSYDVQKKVASFNDKLSGTSLTISQQTLPENFLYDPGAEVEKLAKQINANTKLDAGGATAFMGQSIKGPQTVVFTKNNLLIFVKSESIIDTKSWNDYVSSFNK